jgi:predicted ATPase/class 3 adenylate cyclase/DNA-binding CsgD family transcriptional regulator
LRRLPLTVDTGGVGGEFSLPAGTVTFLLADIEPSTRNREADRAAIAPTLARHHELLDQAVAEHGGLLPLEQGAGDSVVAAFAKASDAVAAAVAAQRALVAELGSVFRVRMAVHTGEAMLRPDIDSAARNYVGPAIIRAARLRACGHGGQVLVSGAAADLAADLLPEGVSLVDLGSRRLRDLVRPERVFQLAHADLPGEFPPLCSLEELPNTLPTPLTSLLGRHDELTALPAVLAEHRLVTLTGAGGVGKTRLAQQVAADLIDRHPGGTWWIELAPATTAEAVTSAVADGMQLSLRPAPAPAEQLVAHLERPNHTLMVLDNCEHVIDAVAPLVHRLLTACPSLSILATSRERLGVPGEQVWRVASLACPGSGEVLPLDRLDTFDAVTLFVDRARQARPNFAVDEHSAPNVAAICARLDGIPLAIELAAARTRSLPVERVASGLDDAFRLLTGGPQVVVPRQQTLLASITWSYELLDDTDRAVLRRLAVCPTWFAIDAAEAVGAGGAVAPIEVLDSLTRLVDKNLLEYDDVTGRYRMLETIRQFGFGRLTDASELHPTRQRYAEYWAARTRVIGGGKGYDPHAAGAAMTDIMTMLDWAMAEDAEMADRVLAAARGLFGLSRWAELHRACDWLLADRPHGPHWVGAVAHLSVGATMMGRHDVLAVTDEALRLAEEAGDTVTAHHLRVAPAYVRLNTGDLSVVRALVIDAMADDDKWPAWAAVTALANALAYLGQHDELSAACRVGAQVLTDMANASFTVDDCAIGPAQAVADHLAGDLDAPIGRMPSRRPAWEMFALMWAEMAGRVAVDRDDPVLAARAAMMIDAPEGPGSAGYHGLAVWAQRVVAGDLEGAAESADAAAAGARTAFQEGHALSVLAATLAALERWDDTSEALRRVEEVLAPITEPAPRIRAGAAVTRARAALAGGQMATAGDAAHEALRTAKAAGLPLFQIDALEAVAAVALAAGDKTRAARLLASADTERERRGYRGRLTSAVPTSACARLAADHAGAWDEGTALTLEEAIALGQRSRGPRGRPSFGADALTPTERLVVDHITHGRTNAEIAAELFVTVPTIKTHLTRIFDKLGVRNRAELAALGAQTRQS